MFDSRIVLACLFLVACGEDGAAASDPGTTSPSEHTQDGGAEHRDADGGTTSPRPSAAGSSSVQSPGGAGGSGGAGGTTATEAGSSGKRGRADAGSGGRRGREEAGGGGEGGRTRPGNGRGRAAAGSGGMASGPECPATRPSEGSACDGMLNLRCSYDGEDCRCRHSEPVWTCDTPAGKRGGAGAGGR